MQLSVLYCCIPIIYMSPKLLLAQDYLHLPPPDPTEAATAHP